MNRDGGKYVLANLVQEANADNAIQISLYPSRDDMPAGDLLLAAHPTCLRDGWQTNDHSASDRRWGTRVLGTDCITARC